MMMTLLLLKNKMKLLYERHYFIIRGMIKIVLTLFSLMIVTGQMDYSPVLSYEWVLFLLAFLCGFFPDFVALTAVCLVICLEILPVSFLLSATVFMIILAYLLLLGRISRSQFYIVLAVPVLSAVHIGYAVPLVSALFVSPALLPALVFGVLLWFMMQGIGEYAAVTTGAEAENVTSSVQYLFRYLMKDRMLFLAVIAFSLTFFCVYIIRRRNFKHASQIAILAGAIVLMTVELLTNIIFSLGINMGALTLQVVISMGIAYIIQFFRMTLDYQGTKKLQFEDDEYYYYVTAVPKYKVAVGDRTVTRIKSDKES